LYCVHAIHSPVAGRTNALVRENVVSPEAALVKTAVPRSLFRASGSSFHVVNTSAPTHAPAKTAWNTYATVVRRLILADCGVTYKSRVETEWARSLFDP
jgi:hypothetical protein